VAVLCYHTVEPGWTSGLAMEPATFRRHAEWLARSRRVVDLDTAVAIMDRRGRLPRGTTCLTFDDGLSGLYEHALPVLHDLGLPATVFVVARTLVEDPTVDWIDDPPAEPLTTLSLDQLREMVAAGIRIASHSQAHRDLPELTPDECREDLTTSRAVLEDLLGGPIDHLAYPRGRHDAGVRAAAERAGYRYAFALPERREPVGPWSLPRVGVYRHNEVATLRVKDARRYLGARQRVGPALTTVRRRDPSAGRAHATGTR
jgi:peptidoglycan/xylan/chitin deacetylase (PgdA/CDA1 family)